VVIVKIPKPWYAPRFVIKKKMREFIPEYAKLPGLAFKAFSLERESGDYGGIYYWQNRSIAQNWFNPAWFDRVKKERGNEANVRIFDAPLSMDNISGGTQADPDSKSVATLVEIPISRSASREELEMEFHTDSPRDQKIPGLLRKYFTISDQNTFGGVYLWKDEASAKAWFNAAWHKKTIETYGKDASIEWFDTPILQPGRDANRIPSNAFVCSVR